MTINTFFLRVSACCNLDCDYCYVFKHRDTSWKEMPRVMSVDTVRKFAERLKEYVKEKYLNTVTIVFHGGEPLMCGENNLLNFVNIIDSYLGEDTKVNYSMQTNGTLLTESFLSACENRNIGISLSLDGPKCVHNAHRKYKTGLGSYDDVIKGVEILKKHSSIFEGIIGVIDPDFSPELTLDFFDNLNVENIDLLLPDSTYIDLPKGRLQNPDLYKQWLIDAFDLWFNNHQSIRLRTFEHILSAIMGENGALDAFGLGSLDYLTIETDGSYHTSDILKVAYNNASAIGFGIYDDTIEKALASTQVKHYNELLSFNLLPEKCKKCAFSNICGGGSLPHRYNEENKFDNPSIYCYELFSLINHAIDVIKKAIESETK